MKKVLTLAFALLLGASLSFAQATGGDKKPEEKKPAAEAKKTSTDAPKKGEKKGHKGGKKSKKGSESTTPPPK